MSSTASALIAQLYRQEARKITYFISKKYGLCRYGDAEDIVQYAFEQALQKWTDQKLPENPTAWLVRIAQNKAIDRFKEKSKTDSLGDDEYAGAGADTHQASLGSSLALDSTVAMALVCCHPELSEESQIALALRTVFSFSVDEVSRALGIKYDTAEKRLTRARAQAKAIGIQVDVSGHYEQSVSPILRIIYLCFNEGYYSRSKDPLKADLCLDAFSSLNHLLRTSTFAVPEAHALFALLCFHYARINARFNADEMSFIKPEEQDRTLFNKPLIEYGNYYLNLSASGSHISRYHLEAAIAAVHTNAATWQDIDWSLILNYYQQLNGLWPTHQSLLAQLVAKAKVHGEASILAEYASLGNAYASSFYFHSLGMDLGMATRNEALFSTSKEKALALALNDVEVSFVKGKVF